MSNSDRIYVVLPAYNEAGKIGRVVEKVRKITTVERIVVVDDCSSDATSAEARAAGAEVVRHEINRGVGAAIRTGIAYGIANGFDICTILSGDDQHEPTEIDRVVGPIIAGEYDFIQGSRRMAGGKVVNDRPFRMITTQLYSLLFSLLVRKRITDATNGFRAFRVSLFEKHGIDLNQDWLDRYELEPYILYQAIKTKQIRLKEVPITIYYHQDPKSYTKMRPFRDWWRLAKPMVYLALRLRK
ncbi:MAG: glycosyltransferase family 2 protein [candidate division Zixibacteria bacterium]|nr:glycosyltransferase family 2 protein [candidate division Zixibacteria bacterium]